MFIAFTPVAMNCRRDFLTNSLIGIQAGRDHHRDHILFGHPLYTTADLNLHLISPRRYQCNPRAGREIEWTTLAFGEITELRGQTIS